MCENKIEQSNVKIVACQTPIMLKRERVTQSLEQYKKKLTIFKGKHHIINNNKKKKSHSIFVYSEGKKTRIKNYCEE